MHPSLGLACNRYYHGVCLMVSFHFPHPFYIYELEFLCKEETSLLISFFILHFMVLVGSPRYFLCPLDFQDCCYFFAEIVPALAISSSFSCLFESCALLTWFHHILSISLLSGNTRHSRFILYFPPGINHLCKEPWFPLLDNGI